MCGRFDTSRLSWSDIHRQLSTLVPVKTAPSNLMPNDNRDPMKPLSLKGIVLLMSAVGYGAIVTAASATELPNATDLKAAYCARVLVNQLGVLTAFEPLAAGNPEARAVLMNQRAQFEDRQRRILAYLLPRVPSLDVSGLSAAASAADADLATNSRLTQAARCGGSLEEVNRCGDAALRNSPALAAMKKCDTLEWLPF
jgi:hypothetical protein